MRKIPYCITVLAVALLSGCSRPAGAPSQSITMDPLASRQAMTQACNVLEEMHFRIDKAAPDQGLILTAPLPGAQWFEFWRQDNVSVEAALEANLQSLRRTVELRLIPAHQPVRIECRVKIERLSFPTQAIASSAQAYRMLTKGTPTIQRLQLHETQMAQMDWLDLGEDLPLAGHICDRIQSRLATLN